MQHWFIFVLPAMLLYVVVLILGREGGREGMMEPFKGPVLLWAVQTVLLESQSGDPWIKGGNGGW